MTSLTPFRVVIPGPPVAQGRGKAHRFGRGIRVSDPPRAKAWKAAAALVYRAELARLRQGPFLGPVRFLIVAAFPRAASDKGDTVEWSERLVDDADNVAKACMDAGKGIVYPNDGLTSLLVVARLLAPAGHPGGVLADVTPLARANPAEYWLPELAAARLSPGSAVARARPAPARRGRALGADAVERLRAQVAASPFHGPGSGCRLPGCRRCAAAARLAEEDPIGFAAAREPEPSP